jgi:pimeloyl-ACP methyl ester carboxylesterase
VLFVPGNSSSLLEGFRGVLDALRGAEDMRIAFWAYRGFDASTGVPTPTALADDLWQQWQRLQALGATPANTQIWGYSLGSVLAVQLAARMAANGQSPARLVLIAAAEQIPVMPYGRFGRFLADDVFDATAAIEHVDCPTLIVHGTDDDALPIAGARRLATALGARATLHEIPGKGHLDLWDDVRRLLW